MAETINVKNLSKTYDGKTMILEDFSYTFESVGSIFPYLCGTS